jgi:hypothetical protein
VEIDKAFDPMAIGLPGPSAVMAGTQGFTETIQKFRGLSGRKRRAGVLADWL